MKNLLADLKSLVARERKATLLVLRKLREVEIHELHLQLGYSSLFVFCVEELGYSEPEAHIRIQAMRLLREVPEVAHKIEAGELSLSVAAKPAANAPTSNLSHKEASIIRRICAYSAAPTTGPGQGLKELKIFSGRPKTISSDGWPAPKRQAVLPLAETHRH